MHMHLFEPGPQPGKKARQCYIIAVVSGCIAPVFVNNQSSRLVTNGDVQVKSSAEVLVL